MRGLAQVTQPVTTQPRAQGQRPGQELSQLPPSPWGHRWPVQGVKEQAPFEAKPAGAAWEGTRSRRCHTVKQAVPWSPLAPVPWLHPKARLDRWHLLPWGRSLG